MRRKAMKRVQAAFLCAFMAIFAAMGITATEVHAQNADYFDGTITNTLPNGTVQQIKCGFKITKKAENGNPGEVQIGGMYYKGDPIDKGTEGSIEIPNTIAYNGDQYNITHIYQEAFKDCTKLTNTGLGKNSSVTSVGTSAFEGCTSLTDTGLSENKTIENISSDVFKGCTSLTDTGLGTNSTVKNIAGFLFKGCTNLTHTGLETNAKLSSIGSSAFEGCTALPERVILGEDSKIEVIGAEAFKGCSQLSEFVIECNHYIMLGYDPFSGTASDFAIYYLAAVTDGRITGVEQGKQLNDGTKQCITTGATVTIEADSPQTGKQFKNWTGKTANGPSDELNDVKFDNENSPSTTFVMNGGRTELTANYTDAPITKYQYMQGADSSWSKGGKTGLAFTIDVDFDKFTGVQINGAPLDASNYTVDSGSRTFTLKPEYLETLDAGTYELKALFTDGEATTNFTIQKNTSGTDTEKSPSGGGTPINGNKAADSPKADAAAQTGDSSNMTLWVILMLIAGGGMLAAVFSRKRAKDKE